MRAAVRLGGFESMLAVGLGGWVGMYRDGGCRMSS